jgi:hypothetical protein
MNILNPRIHRMLDLATVVLFALAPTLFSLAGATALISYALAVVHLAVTLATEFPGGRGPLRLPARGVLELVVGLALVALPWLAGWTGNARTFYIAVGAIIILVWVLTQYRAEAAPGAATKVL